MRHEPRSLPRALGAASVALLVAWTGGCASWRSVERFERWTLYEAPGRAVPTREYEAAFEIAFEAVEAVLGPFGERVRVYAWDSREARPAPASARETAVHEVPGIGPARIQAYHLRGGHFPFSYSGVFIGVPDPGTAAHELVHARLAEEDPSLPLWFEEGVATILGDGALWRGRWYVDGLACWPLRELREEELDDAYLGHLLALGASDESSVRDNVLVHFVGWAIVFDLYRETGVLDWRAWYERFDHEHALRDARARLDRTLAPETVERWLARLDSPDPACRLAAAKGTWKLRSKPAFERLVVALEDEVDDEARVGLAVNALATAGEVRAPWRTRRRLDLAVAAVLREAQLDDPAELEALRELERAYLRFDGELAQRALARLARFWEE